MELYQLEYFVAVAQEGSFTRAARRCLVTQPTLSQQIQKLERELGQPLFQRLGRRVELTEAGRVLYEKAQHILQLAQQAQHEVEEVSGQGMGRVIVGAIPTMAPYLLPELVQRFQQEYPQAELAIEEDLTDHLLTRCAQGELDLAIMALPVKHDQLNMEPLWSEPLLLAVPKDHPLATKSKVTVRDLAKEPFILLDEMHCLGEQIVEFCNRQAYTPLVCCRSAQLLTVQQMVALGHGVSLVPQMAAQAQDDPRVVYRRLSGSSPRRTLVVLWHKHRFLSGAAKAWLEMLRAEAKRRGRNSKKGEAEKPRK